MKRVGVLAVQGAVDEHLARVEAEDCAAVAVKLPEDLSGLDALIIPGGESTAISRLITHNGLFEPIQAFAKEKPVFGTCAGLILCATEIVEDDGRVRPLGLLPCRVTRNGFGRQVQSFETLLEVDSLGPDANAGHAVPGVFIRAPYIESLGPGAKAMAHVDGKIVMAESGLTLVCAFHPELADDNRILRYFLNKIS